jgi:hypothetical protein
VQGTTYFSDIPVYRLPEKQYYAERDAYVRQMMGATMTSPETDMWLRGHLEAGYGGPWSYNEIIGYIRLHFLGSQVRGEYFRVDAKRIVRTRRKTMWQVTHKLAPELEVPRDANSTQVLAVVRRYIQNCRRELPGRYLDDEIFETTAPYIDWRRLWDDV